jgi:hypothetical protein
MHNLCISMMFTTCTVRKQHSRTVSGRVHWTIMFLLPQRVYRFIVLNSLYMHKCCIGIGNQLVSIFVKWCSPAALRNLGSNVFVDVWEVLVEHLVISSCYASYFIISVLYLNWQLTSYSSNSAYAVSNSFFQYLSVLVQQCGQEAWSIYCVT